VVAGQNRHRGYQRRATTALGNVILLIALLTPGITFAQAWLPEAKTFSSTVIFDDSFVRDHYLPDGSTIDVGHVRTETYGFMFSYSPTDRLMLTAGIPLVTTRYSGPPSHGGDPHAEDDDGDAHTTFTDFRIGAHYQLLEHPVALAPLVAIVIPSHDYGTFGHAAHGRDLHEYWIGIAIGKNLSEWIPGAYTQLRYTYAFVEQVQNVGHNRSNYYYELGKFFTRRFNVSAFASWQVTHGGIDTPVPRSNPYYLNHDRIEDEEFVNLGFGGGYSLTPELTAFATYMTSVAGQNTHKLSQGITIGLSYGFRPRAASGAVEALAGGE
jgi:hypothetical protein